MKVFKRFKIIAFVITLVLITGCGSNISCENTQDSESFNKFLDDIFVEDMTQNGLDWLQILTHMVYLQKLPALAICPAMQGLKPNLF